jgi:tetratricopeptide (TPR) repeat protein
MIVDAVIQPTVDIISPTLWRTWFESGLNAIEQKDFTGAIKWLSEAEKHVCKCEPGDKRHALAEANLSFAHLLRLRDWERRIDDPCASDRDRTELKESAEKEKQRATATSSHALSNLSDATSSREISLARARASHVSGDMLKRSDDRAAAIACYSQALKFYQDVLIEEAVVDEILYSLFTLQFQSQAFDHALESVRLLEQHAAASSETYKLASYLVARADCLTQMGQYREARRLYDRWSVLAPECAEGKRQGYSCAFAQTVFGRIHLIMGDYPLADQLISASSCWVDLEAAFRVEHGLELPITLVALRFEVALLKAELALNQGDLVCARELVPLAAALNPPWADRKIRLCLLTAQLHLTLGDFPVACKHFLEAKQLTDGITPCRLPFYVPALIGISRVESETSDWAASIQQASRAVQLLEEKEKGISAEMAAALLALAMAYVRDDRSEAASPLCERARGLIQMTLRSGHPNEAMVHATLADHYISRQQPMLALESCHKTTQLLRQYSPWDGFALARIYRIEGEAHLVDGQISCSARMFECALHVWQEQEERLKCKHCEMSLILLGLATTHIALEDFGDAETTFAQLKQPLCEFKGNAARAGYELNRRGNLMLQSRLYAVAMWLYFHAEEYYRDCYGPDHEFTHQVHQNHDEAKRRADASGQAIPRLINRIAPRKKRLTATVKGKKNASTT